MASYSTGMYHAEAEWELAGRAQGSLPDRIHLQIRQAGEIKHQRSPYPQLLVELRRQHLPGMKQRANTWDDKSPAGYISADHPSHRNWLLIPCFLYAEVFIPKLISSCCTRDSSAQSNRQYICLPLIKSI